MRSASFFWHVLAEYALFNGWDLEGDLVEFASNAEVFKDAIYITSKGGASLSFQDVIALAKGEVTETSKEFFTRLLAEIPELDSQPDETLLLTSMHSGSSDYLTLGNVREIANYDLPNVE